MVQPCGPLQQPQSDVVMPPLTGASPPCSVPGGGGACAGSAGGSNGSCTSGYGEPAYNQMCLYLSYFALVYICGIYV
jgi:hypothetical protein